MKIAKIFHSVQGEGVRIGLPSVFIRFGLCNLDCKWCDTKWAKTEYKEMTTLEVVKKVESYNCRNVVLTGGEPLLQQDAMVSIIEKLLRGSLFYRFEVETNGTIKITNPRLLETVDSWVISPKLSNSGVSISPILHPWVFQEKRGKIFFKFVVDNHSDFKDILNFILKYNILSNVETTDIILMPQCRNKRDHNVKLPFIIDFAKANGFRVTPRLQILVWGNVRGK
jgi:7-carboxy-7-deazaguanine synthase